MHFSVRIVSLATQHARAFKEEGNNEYRKGAYNYAIVCYTEGIKENCDDKNVNAKLFTDRATAHLQLGEYCSLLYFAVLYHKSTTEPLAI